MKLKIGDSVKLKDGRKFKVVSKDNRYFVLKDSKGKMAKVKDTSSKLRVLRDKLVNLASPEGLAKFDTLMLASALQKALKGKGLNLEEQRKYNEDGVVLFKKANSSEEVNTGVVLNPMVYQGKQIIAIQPFVYDEDNNNLIGQNLAFEVGEDEIDETVPQIAEYAFKWIKEAKAKTSEPLITDSLPYSPEDMLFYLIKLSWDFSVTFSELKHGIIKMLKEPTLDNTQEYLEMYGTNEDMNEAILKFVKENPNFDWESVEL